MSVEITIICDGCAVLISAGKTAAKARVDAPSAWREDRPARRQGSV